MNENKIAKSSGIEGLEVVKVLEAAEKSLRNEGKQVTI